MSLFLFIEITGGKYSEIRKDWIHDKVDDD